MRRSFTLFSVVVHSIVIAAGLIAQVLAVGPLPIPHQAVLFDAAHVMPADIRLPKPPQRAAPAASAAPAVSINAAPLTPPDGVMPETGREGTSPAVAGPAIGIVSGLPDAMEGVGTVAVVPAPPPAPPTPVRLHSGMTAPRKVVDVAPVYPAVARSARVNGVVILEAVIAADGSVESVRVLRSIPLLDAAAVTAVQQWRFTPALLNGEPVPVVMTVTVNFTLQDR